MPAILLFNFRPSNYDQEMDNCMVLTSILSLIVVYGIKFQEHALANMRYKFTTITLQIQNKMIGEFHRSVQF
jgi:hypothetical protein